jgi:hypothetical protein
MRRMNWLQAPTVFWLSEGTQFSQLLNVHGVSDVRKIEIRPAGPLVSEPSAFEAEMTIEKLK